MNKLRKLLTAAYLQLALLAILSIGIGYGGVLAATGSNAKLATDSSCDGICISITENGMNPDEIAVRVGEIVQFNTADDKVHNISQGKGDDDSGHHDTEAGHKSHGAKHDHEGSYSSGDFGADEAWRVQFKTPGTYRLHDHYNPKLEILVVVYMPKSDE